MNPFWWLASALILGAAAFLVWPLLGRADRSLVHKRRALDQAFAAGVLDQAEYERKRQALAAQEANGQTRRRPLLAGALLLALPTATLLLYPGLPEEQARQALPHAANDPSLPDLSTAAKQLAARLEQQPEDLAGWVLLGRTYRALERFAEAKEALARAYALAPDHEDLTVEYAEALALAAPNRKIEGEALALIERVLAQNPDHPRALWLRGVAHRQGGRSERAIADWERLLGLLPEDAEVRQEIKRLIAEARRSSSEAPTATASATARGRSLRVLVELDPSLQDRVRPEDTVFVFARPAQGGRAPLAIERLRVADLPAEVRLDASNAMVPELSLERFDEVTVGARVSRRGLAQPERGDLEGLAGPVSTTAGASVRVLIDRVIE